MIVRLLLLALMLTFTFGACSTAAWTFTGHCCGIYIPLVAGDPTACLPAQDREIPTKWLSSGHCDARTLHRVR